MQYASRCVLTLSISLMTSIIEIAFETSNFPILCVCRVDKIVYITCTPDRLHRTKTSGLIRRFQKIFIRIDVSYVLRNISSKRFQVCLYLQCNIIDINESIMLL